MLSLKLYIAILWTVWTVEARSLKAQQNALVEEEAGASFCGQWSAPASVCAGTGPVVESGKSDSECKEWCQSQGIGCCETSTSGYCGFYSGDGASTWSSEASDIRSTYCIGDGYVQDTTRFGECGLDEGLYVVPGPNGDGLDNTLIDCQTECSARDDCNFLTWGGAGRCHLFTTCDGDNFGFWMVMERVDLCASVTCTAANTCHEAGVCERQSGICTNPSLPDGSACDDSNSSTISDQCTEGLCAPAAGASGDPHFIGFDGSRYDFQGSPGSVFNIITDKAFQLNARFIESPTDGKTYMGVVAAKVGSNEVVVTPDVIVVNDRSVTFGDHVYLYDGEESVGLVVIEENHIHVKALSFQVDIKIVQQGEFVYLDINAAANSDHLVHPHGILGQTARYLVDGTQPNPVRLSHKNLYASGFLAGSPDDYLVGDGLFGTDFSFNRFGIEADTVHSQISRRFGFAKVLYQQAV